MDTLWIGAIVSVSLVLCVVGSIKIWQKWEHHAWQREQNAGDQAKRTAEDDAERNAQRSSYLRDYGQDAYDKMYNAPPGAHNLNQQQWEQMYGGGPGARNNASLFSPTGMTHNFTPQYVTVVTHQ
jgi:hypothetical protein